MRTSVKALAVVLFAVGCGQAPGKLEFNPNARLGPPTSKVTPPPGPFNGEVTLTFTSDRDATIYVSVDGSDPRTTTKNRLDGPSPFEVKLTKTTTVSWFASDDGKDEALHTGTWTRAGGPIGTISGKVIVGDFMKGKRVGVLRNAESKNLGKPMTAGEIPFTFTGVQSGQHRLQALGDRNDDDQLIPFLDLQSDVVTVTIDLKDPFKAAAENVVLFLATSPPELCTIAGTITLPKPPAAQNLRISALASDAFTGLDPTVLLQQLQGGYQIFTSPTQIEYPYVLTDLKPGRYLPVPTLLGFGAGGVAMNFIANPLSPVTCVAGETATKDFAFGPVTVTGTATLDGGTPPADGGMGGPGFNFGVVAAKNLGVQGAQAVLMPTIFAQDPASGELRSAFGAQALRPNSSFQFRVFTQGASPASNPLVEALTWVANPFAAQPPHATVTTGNGSSDTVLSITVP